MFRQALVLIIVIMILLCVLSSCSKKSTEPQVCATPTFNPEGGTYSFFAAVTISSETDGAIIRYTIDGNEPSSNSFVYSSFITLLTTTTIKAQAFKSGWTASEVATATYTIQ